MHDEPKVNILVIDDSPDKLLALEAILDELGENIVKADSGREGLRKLLSDDYAVILLDVNMPEMDGFETAELIRQRKRSEHTPIIFITAYNDEIRVARGYSLGAVDYIQTPVVPEVLRAKVAVFVDLFRKTELVRSQGQRQLELVREQTARAAAEESKRRSEFLAEASTVLARSLDLSATVAAIASVGLPILGDAAVVSLVESTGRPSRTELALAPGIAFQPVTAGHPLGEAIGAAAARVAQSGRTELTTAPVADPNKPAASAVQAIVAPLIARGVTHGTLVLARFGGTYLPRDLSLAEDFAGRAALAIDNARLYEEILDGDRRKDEFLAMLGHELRNPLGAASNALQCLDLAQNDPSTYGEVRSILDRQIQHMARLVDDLLDVSRITRGKVRLQKELLELQAVLDRAVTSTRSFLTARRHELLVDLPGAPIRLEADQTRLEQIFSNLLNNAAKYSEPGSKIWLSAEVNGEAVTVRIKDSGIGIHEELLPRVFDLFTQADRSLDRSQGGLGVGLTLARSLVRLHGGEISVVSEGLGLGSEFAVRLPIVRQAAAIEPPAGDQPLPAEPLGRRILLVDDNRDLATALATLLRSAGHEVHVSGDPLEALNLAPTLEPDVALVDIGLPGMNGYQLAQRLRDYPLLDKTLLVAMTGYGQAEDRRRSREAGFDHHLVKPISFQKLLDLLAGEPALHAGLNESLAD